MPCSRRAAIILPCLSLTLLAPADRPRANEQPAATAGDAQPPTGEPAQKTGEPAAPPKGPEPVMAPAGSFSIGGAIYLFAYAPRLAKDKFEIYAFLLNIDATTRDEKYGLHVQTRFRDSKLREFFLSNIWFQEAYGWTKTPIGDIHAGKFYRKVGILWDDSFFGNVQYFNGLKLNPDYGVELVGSRSLWPGFSIDYSGQFLANNDHVAGSAFGRDVESDGSARLQSAWTGRVVPGWKLGEKTSFSLGISGYTGRIDRSESGSDFRIEQVAADLTLAWGPSISYVEALKQRGQNFSPLVRQGPLAGTPNALYRSGYDTATYFLAGTRWQVLDRLKARVNYSQAIYDGAASKEVEIVPGIVFSFRPNFALIVEYDYWKTEPDRGPSTFIDRSYNYVLNYNF